MSFSKFYVLSNQGDPLVARDYHDYGMSDSSETFFREVISKKEELPPIVYFDGFSFFYHKNGVLYFVLTSRDNVQPSFALEFLMTIEKNFKNYCTVVSEEAFRANFVTLNEIIDEMIDNGYPQLSTPETLGNFINSKPIVIKKHEKVANLEDAKDYAQKKVKKALEFLGSKPSAVSTSEANRAMASVSGKGRSELFVDVNETITVIFNSKGSTISTRAEGSIVVRNFIQGVPEVVMQLCDDISIGSGSRRRAAGPMTVLDDCNFHECVSAPNFASDHTMHFVPPQGEIHLMNYRVSSLPTVPFHIFPIIEEVSPVKVNVVIKLKSDFPNTKKANKVVVTFPVPKSTAGAYFEGGADAEFIQKENVVHWNLRRAIGGEEYTLITRLTLEKPSTGSIQKEIGPISLAFEIPMWNCTGVRLITLDIIDRGNNKKHFKWLRCKTFVASYVRRIT